MRLVQAGLCTSCMTHYADGLVDFDISFDGQPVLDKETGTIALDPVEGLPMMHDELRLCFSCLREACELASIEPQREQELVREVNRLTIEDNGLRELLRRRSRELDEMTNAKIGPPPQRGPGRPRKQPVSA